MGSNDKKSQLVYDLKLSSVVPASITGESKSHHLKNMDLIMKCHYLKGVYLFNKDAAEGFSIKDFKEPMFLCLQFFYHVAGRIRKGSSSSTEDGDGDGDGDGGGVFIKCNDSGVRVVEAKCCKTLDQWLLDRLDDDDEMLVHHDHVLGPDLEFAPLVFLQFTWFKCGGISIGLSWAHILGDAFTASQFINLWGHFIAGNPMPSKNLVMAGTRIHKSTSSVAKTLHSIKLINPVGGQWLVSNDGKMKVRSINVTAHQLKNLVSKISEKVELKPFEVISALVWKYLAKIRGVNEPSIVTICRNDTSCQRSSEIWCNSQVISTAEAGGLKVAEADLLELAELIAKKQVDESSMIETVERKSDFILYGANLTFVDLEDAQMYDMELKGHKPVFADYRLSGVGDEGTVMVLPAREEGGRVVNLILPESDVAKLQHELRNQLGI